MWSGYSQAANCCVRCGMLQYATYPESQSRPSNASKALFHLEDYTSMYPERWTVLYRTAARIMKHIKGLRGILSSLSTPTALIDSVSLQQSLSCPSWSHSTDKYTLLDIMWDCSSLGPEYLSFGKSIV